MPKNFTIIAVICALVVIVIIGISLRGKQPDAVQVAFAQLDYKAMDAHGIPRSMIENAVKTCVNGAMQRSTSEMRTADLCACLGNGMATSITKEEFSKYNAAFAAKTRPDPVTQKKFIKIAAQCRKKYGSK